MKLLTLRALKTEVHPQTKMMFWFLFASSRGAQNRIRIVRLLGEHPRNANQISQDLSLDYKAVKHHLGVLEKNNLVGKFGGNYGATYFVSPLLEENKSVFDEISSKLNF